MSYNKSCKAYLEMEMPESCAKCELFGEYGCPFIGAVGYALTEGRRNEDCPLVPVPPHWKLIDMNQVARYLSHCAEDRDFVRPPVSWKEAFDEIIGVLNDFPGIQSERTSYYEYCNDCPVPFASADDKEMCGWHWRPKSGTKTGFPDKDGWNCPKDTARCRRNDRKKSRCCL